MTLSPKTLKKIHRLQLKMEQVATDLLAGLYRSTFKGKGLEFEEVRKYQPGDDIRTIDWNVTARMHHPYIKRFREERELTVMLMVDISASTFFGSHSNLKSNVIAEIGGLLAFSAIKNQDKIGLILFSDEVELYLPPKKGTRHVLRMIRELFAFQAKGKKTEISKALSFFGKTQKGRTVCFLISDFIGPSFKKEIAPLAKKHEIIAICIRDPLEKIFSPAGLVHLVNAETQQTFWLDSDSSLAQQSLKSSSAEALNQLEGNLKQLGVGWIMIDSSQSYVGPIRKFFKSKQRKAAWASK